MGYSAPKPNTPNSGGLRGAEYDVKRFNNFSSPVTRTRIGEQKRCTRKKLRIFGVFSRFRGKNYKGYTVDAFG